MTDPKRRAAARGAAASSSGAAPAAALHPTPQHPVGPDPDGHDQVLLAVVAAHRTGQPLHHQLVELGARFAGLARTAPVYRLIAMPGPGVLRGGIVPSAVGGTAVEVELHRLSSTVIGALLRILPPSLAIGTIMLTRGTAFGMVCVAEPAGALDISTHGSWPAFLATVGAGALMPMP